MKTVLVCGCRDWTNKDVLFARLDAIDFEEGISVLIQGGAAGADSWAKRWAEMKPNAVPVREFKADWDTHGRAAGFIRNSQMLSEGKPDLVVAFWDGRSPGTLDMIKKTVQAGIPVEIVPKL